MNNDNLNRLILLCQQMYQQGKSPSVGMLRSKAPFKVSVTEAIEAIKRFNANQPSTAKPTAPSTNSAPAENLESRVTNLEKEVTELKLALHKLLQTM